MMLPTTPAPDLTPVQLQVLSALASGLSVSAAARAAGVHRSTVHNWLNSEPFAAQFDTSRQEFVESLRDQLRDLSALALDTIRHILEDPKASPSVRLKAALAVLNRPAFPKQEWALPESLYTPGQQEQLHQTAQFKASIMELEYGDKLLRLPNPHAPAQPPQPPQVGRNSPCPCGSKQKFKRCCGSVSSPPLLHGAPHTQPLRQ